MVNTFIFEEKNYEADKQQSKAAVFSVGNGFYGCRGFHEESQEPLTRLGGIYQAGLFGQGVHEAYDGSLITELLNTPNVLRVEIVADGERIDQTNCKVKNFYQRLDMANGLYQRGYTAVLSSGKELKIKFERLAHLTEYHLLGQQIVFDSSDDISLQLTTFLDGDVTNLNLESTEPWPIQPGRRHLSLIESQPNLLHLQGDYQNLRLLQKSREWLSNADHKCISLYEKDALAPANQYSFVLSSKKSVIFQRIIASTNNAEEADYLDTVDQYLDGVKDYATLKCTQSDAWQAVWKNCDVRLKNNDSMQIALRYNLFQLYSSAPRHTDELSIGARGLTGEMYEGCVFWDLEIFKFPFFLYQFPQEAKKLLHFRYHTLQEAKKHAKRNLFDGAFFPWQVSAQGVEQTQKNVGAYYAVHIVADIAYAINKYMRVTNDQAALKEFLAELLIETSRFWVSRVSLSVENKGYEILAVRGPNEYDVIVNNNCYTNTMAAENLSVTVELLSRLSADDPVSFRELTEKTGLTIQELANFESVAENIWIPYDMKEKLYLEDEKYLARRRVPIALLKPGAKRVVDSTLPYEALSLYQITKQADIVQMMNLLPENYTFKEKQDNFNFYLERTAHDSSLSICGYGLMAARLGDDQQSKELFTKALYFDMEDRLLNTISGLHYANFGGVWQIATTGFLGIEVSVEHLSFYPYLPNYLEELSTQIYYLGNQLIITLTKECFTLQIDNFQTPCQIEIKRKIFHIAGPETITVEES